MKASAQRKPYSRLAVVIQSKSVDERKSEVYCKEDYQIHPDQFVYTAAPPENKANYNILIILWL
jgi:hypothetical protein